MRMLTHTSGQAIEVLGGPRFLVLGVDDEFTALTRAEAIELARALLVEAGVKGTPCAQGATSYTLEPANG